MRVKPFVAWRPPAELAGRVASLPYDVVDTPLARRLAEGNPHSFLHVVRSEIDLPGGTYLYSDEVYAMALANLRRFMREGVLQRDAAPALYVYRQAIGSHAQVGVVAVCHVDDYEENRILRHEKTLKPKEDDRTRHIDTLSTHTGPVFLTYRDDSTIDAQVEAVLREPPLYDFTAVDGVRHTVWRVGASPSLVESFARVPAAYVADGHHRAASAARVARLRREADPAHDPDKPHNWFLAVLFPGSQLRILPYNRVVLDLHGHSVPALLDAVGRSFRVAASDGPTPERPGQIRMFVGDAWYGLEWDPHSESDPVESLDVSRLQAAVLGPVLGIEDVRTSQRIEFVGGIHGPKAVEDRVRETGGVGFSMYPVTVKQLMSIADAGRIMPPKSTWFEPKLRSGLLVHHFGPADS